MVKRKLIILALAAIGFAACSNQPQVMENQAIKNIMTRVSVREFIKPENIHYNAW